MITSKGYPCEDHKVITEDGYILTMQRIPHGRNTNSSTGDRPVVILQHGLLGESTNYLDNLANESLAYVLADAGADVWLSNSRGNTYSRAHTHLKPSQVVFWDWSFDEMARFDLPAVVDYVLAKSGQSQVIYVGHSQGTTIGFAGFSQNQTLASKIKLFVALAPVAKVAHIRGPYKLVGPYAYDLEFLTNLFGLGQFQPTTEFDKLMATDVCPHVTQLCTNLFFLHRGSSFHSLNQSRIPVYVAHNPAGTSAKNMVHFAQAIKTDTFQKYDYRSGEKNILHYGQPTPPAYHPENMTVPVAVFRGGDDWLADPQDIEWLLPKLQNLIYDKNIDHWEHIDFIFGLDAPELCYSVIVDLIFNKNSTLLTNQSNRNNTISVP
ncbi:gastric triacylglycerol lipase [Patella vulgata]|uniref:gastric triacylglycerol lipase n=1 Tax=Patella vulgata TaxID=6465 RepID=UPI00217FB7E1|nr:gastric triacylglycerol lipase [Patella vulgata]